MKRTKGVILLTSVCGEDSMVSSVKIARFLHRLFNFPVYCWKNHGELVAADWVLYINSSTLFTDEPYRVFSQKLLRSAQNVIYIQNDYKLPFPTRWRRAAERGGANITYWSTVERVVQKKGGAFLDWNRLGYDPVAGKRVVEKDQVFYYGAYRQDRAERFEHYFKDPVVPTTISVPTVSQREKFERSGISEKIQFVVDKSDIVKQLRDYSATLYLEDPYSSRNNTCLANRFYEALSAGTALAVDREAVGTFADAGLNLYDEFAVDGPHCLRRFLRSAGEISKQQARLWRRDYVSELRSQVLRAARSLGVER